MPTTPCDVLEDLAKAGGHLVETGTRKYDDWAKAMRDKVSPHLTDATLQRTWATVRAELAASAPIRARKMGDVFADQLGKRIGRGPASEFIDAMDDLHPAIFEKLVKGDALTADERQLTVELYSRFTRRGAKPGAPQPGGMGEITKAMREASAELRRQSYERGKPARDANRAAVRARRTPEEILRDAIAPTLGKKDAADAFLADVQASRPDLLAKLANGQPMTPAELSDLAAFLVKHRAAGTGQPAQPAQPATVPQAVATLRAASKTVAAERAAQAKAARAPITAQRRQAAAEASARKGAEARLQDMSDLFPERPKGPDRDALLPAGVKAYRDGARDLARFAAKLRRDLGADIDDATMQALFTDAARRYKADYKLLDTIKGDVANVMAKEAWRNAPLGVKSLATARNVAGVPMSLLTSGDFSAPFRQGLILTLANPNLARKAVVPMFRAVREGAAQDIDIAIRSRPNADLYEKSGLYLADIDNTADLTGREEMFRENLTEKVPGLKQLVGASSRSYATYLNRLRADTFDMFVRDLSAGGKYDPTDAELTAIADFVNVATGRGAGKVAEKAASLNGVLFAPRYMVSRFQAALGQPLLGGSARTRKLVARTYLQYAGMMATVMTLAELGGAEIEKDPRSSDFLKIKFGDRVLVDPHAGMGQVATLLARLYSGKTKTGAGEVKPTKPQDVVASFARGKLAPIPAAAADFLSRDEKAPYGKNFIGQDVSKEGGTASRIAKAAGSPIESRQAKAIDYYFSRLGLPMNLGDITEAAAADGMGKAEAVALVGLVTGLTTFGVGARTFDRDERMKRRQARTPPPLPTTRLIRRD